MEPCSVAKYHLITFKPSDALVGKLGDNMSSAANVHNVSGIFTKFPKTPFGNLVYSIGVGRDNKGDNMNIMSSGAGGMAAVWRTGAPIG